MFDYLRKEIFMLRGKNSDLKTELRDAETDKRELLSHAESAEAAASASRLRVAQLTKNNSTLMAEIMEQKHEVASLKKEVKASSDHKEEVVANIKTGHDLQLRQQEAEIKSLQAGMRETRTTAEYEKRLLKDELGKMEEEHTSEVMRLKDELRRTQDSHHDYLAKLMDVLETTHSAREGEMNRISAELNAVKEEKDAQIMALQQEVESLHKLSKTDVSVIQKQAAANKAAEVTGVRREVEKNQLVRGQRGQKFFEVVDKLTAAVASENLIDITSKRRARGKKLSVVDEESQRMKKMIRFLSDLYALEESSQAKVDSDMLRMLDSYKAAAEPNRKLSELEFQLKQIEAENKRLKEQVRLHGNCPRCEARDKRRAARQKTGGTASTQMMSTPPSRTSSNASSQYSNTSSVPRRSGAKKTYRGNY
uniref:Uncharacterized protein n=1 Tax=Grammatophora oceanica TaxID=210454 RepID=A0A7S1YKS9_9STRA